MRWRPNRRGIWHLYESYRPQLGMAIRFEPLCGDRHDQVVTRPGGDDWCRYCIAREARL